MPLTDNTPDTQVREVLAHGGDEAFLMSMSESMDTLEQLLEACTGVLWHLSSGNIDDDTPFHIQRRHCAWIRP
jgi:hypothetical protein